MNQRTTADQRVKSSLSSRPITGSFWAGLATFLLTCPVDRLNQARRKRCGMAAVAAPKICRERERKGKQERKEREKRRKKRERRKRKERERRARDVLGLCV